MDELVPEDVVRLGEPAGEREDHAALEAFGHAARSLTDLARERVGLLEVRVCGVEDDRLPGAQLVAEHARQTRVPPFGHTRREVHRLLLFRVVVDVEVLGLLHLEVELLVLHLVLAEVLRLGGRGAPTDQRQKRQKDASGSKNHWCLTLSASG